MKELLLAVSVFGFTPQIKMCSCMFNWTECCQNPYHKAMHYVPVVEYKRLALEEVSSFFGFIALVL